MAWGAVVVLLALVLAEILALDDFAVVELVVVAVAVVVVAAVDTEESREVRMKPPLQVTELTYVPRACVVDASAWYESTVEIALADPVYSSRSE